ncbi:hypothetical protein BC937DRAFT_92932 [Endogone sp. FLAS-F59071]|nr:hypothetical protein BC937DRAFT_92932 [Endogone sp. FLAS-F59071]|eukprot:RUS15076.1 hypothetical protein BC937DRAFT_92932 [Endogone sp. FLAS-F59071]
MEECSRGVEIVSPVDGATPGGSYRRPKSSTGKRVGGPAEECHGSGMLIAIIQDVSYVYNPYTDPDLNLTACRRTHLVRQPLSAPAIVDSKPPRLIRQLAKLEDVRLRMAGWKPSA